MLEWVIMPFKRWSDFDSRSRRKEYWMFTLGITMTLLLLFFVEEALGMGGSVGGTYGPLTLFFAVAIFVPGLALQIRRFHDQNKSGWFFLLNFIPFVGWVIVLAFSLLEGTKGENRFGPDPKAGDVARTA